LYLRTDRHVNQVGHPEKPSAEAVGDPDVALTVDVHTAIKKPGLEVLGFGRIGRGEARDIVAAVRNPDPVLLVDGDVKWVCERFARLGVLAIANQPTLGPIAIREVHELVLADAERPHVAADGHNNNALHFSELAAKCDFCGTGMSGASGVAARNSMIGNVS